MSVLVYTESENGKLKKAALEVASYAFAVASQLGTTVTAVTFNANDASVLGKHGVSKVLNVSNISQFDAKLYAEALKQASEKEGGSCQYHHVHGAVTGGWCKEACVLYHRILEQPGEQRG